MSVLKTIKVKINTVEFLMYLLAIALSTLLLGYAPSGIALGIFIVFSLRYAFINKVKVKVDLPLLLPMLLYMVFVASLIWSVDKQETLKGLERTIALILVPLAFICLPKLSTKEIKVVLNTFTISNFVLGIFFLIIAIFNFFKTKELSSFTYHDLVSVFDLNAIYVSLIFAVSLFYLVSLKQKTNKQKALILFFLLFLFLLSSKTILFVVCIGVIIFIFRQRNSSINKKRIVVVVMITSAVLAISSITLSERFLFEKHTKFNEVLEQEKFGKVYYWTGSSIRLMQLRILKEQIEEEAILWKGFGLFASKRNVEERHQKFDTYFKFHKYNYHNQYAQILSETGILGCSLLLMMLITIWWRGVKTKNYLVIMFSIMMVLIFFTESVLWRQRGLFLFIVFYSLFAHTIFDDKHLKLQSKS